ncbi:MAG TPA: asparagine synthase-related protein [Pyrinomonadaceae bacterium]|nr:asparagine synthase-related protein [Pyrinomonadaceae bacterium]
MSTLGGIYNFNDNPFDSEEVIILARALATRGPDGGSEVRRDSVIMLFHTFNTNRESRREVQPFLSDTGHIISWDGRLDNRRELISDLNVPPESTDVAIVSAAYQKFGQGFLGRLVGDFALAIWDSAAKALILARDPVGTRSLFYWINLDRIVWSSLLLPLVDLAQETAEIDNEYIAAYLTRDYQPEVTPYKGIYAVAPAHAVIVDRFRLSLSEFWQPDFSNQIRYKSDKEYEEHFYQLFEESVRCRLRVDGPVCAQLSGGLDSSSIVCMADRLIKCGEVPGVTLETVSYIYDGSEFSDERKFIRCVEKQCGMSGSHISELRCPPLTDLCNKPSTACPDFLDCFSTRHRALCDAMETMGARVLLTGHGGDEMLYSGAAPPPVLSNLLAGGHLLQLHQQLQTWSSDLKRSYLNLLWQEVFMRLFSTEFQANHTRRPDHKMPPWFDSDFVTRMNLRSRNIRPRQADALRVPSDREQLMNFLAAVSTVSTGAYRERGLIETSHPYLHLPLVEFLQAIPFDQKVRPGETRSLMRRAFRELLPERIVNRRGKRGPEEAFFRAVNREWPSLQSAFSNPIVCKRGYMDRERLQKALERARHGCERYSFALIKTIALEFWFRALEHRTAIARKRTASTTAMVSAGHSARATTVD